MTEAQLRERIQSVPKTDLHVHLDGCLRPETIVELAGEYGVDLPSSDVNELTDYLFVQDAHDLEDYLARFELTLSVMQHGDALERITYELCEDAAAENVVYMEIRYSPILHTRLDLPLPETVEAPLRGIGRAERDFGIQANLIVCGIRNMDPDVSRDLAELTVGFKERGVVAFDLAGGEAGNPAREHADAFRVVRNANIGITVHAGEAAGSESIHQALHDCGARRIGHGTRLFEDPDLMQYVNDFRVPIEVCLTSNVQTRATEDFATHPVRLYFDEGLLVSLHTDNRLMSGTTVTEEYVRAWKHLEFTPAELAEMVLNGFRSSFLHQRDRAALLTEVEPAVQQLDA